MANSSCPPCTPLIQDPPSTGEDPTVLGPCSQNRPHNNFPHFSMLISSHREVQLVKMLINCNSLHPLHNHGGKEGAKNLSQIFLVRPQKWTPISPPPNPARGMRWLLGRDARIRVHWRHRLSISGNRTSLLGGGEGVGSTISTFCRVCPNGSPQGTHLPGNNL